MNIIIFGPPGAGKGTQSDKIASKYQLFKISTGDLLRNEIKKGTLLGKKIEEIVNSGTLVSDNVINDLIEKVVSNNKYKNQIIFDEKAKEAFLKGAKIAYETVITNFASGNLKSIKYLLDKKVFDQFNESLRERENKGYMSETTFVGIDSASIKEHNKINSILEVTVDFVSEIISCVKDKDNKILSGDPEKVKKVFDTWKFKKDSRSNNPNWLLIDTQI